MCNVYGSLVVHRRNGVAFWDQADAVVIDRPIRPFLFLSSPSLLQKATDYTTSVLVPGDCICINF